MSACIFLLQQFQIQYHKMQQNITFMFFPTPQYLPFQQSPLQLLKIALFQSIDMFWQNSLHTVSSHIKSAEFQDYEYEPKPNQIKNDLPIDRIQKTDYSLKSKTSLKKKWKLKPKNIDQSNQHHKKGSQSNDASTYIPRLTLEKPIGEAYNIQNHKTKKINRETLRAPWKISRNTKIQAIGTKDKKFRMKPAFTRTAHIQGSLSSFQLTKKRQALLLRQVFDWHPQTLRRRRPRQFFNLFA